MTSTTTSHSWNGFHAASGPTGRFGRNGSTAAAITAYRANACTSVVLSRAKSLWDWVRVARTKVTIAEPATASADWPTPASSPKETARMAATMLVTSFRPRSRTNPMINSMQRAATIEAPARGCTISPRMPASAPAVPRSVKVRTPATRVPLFSRRRRQPRSMPIIRPAARPAPRPIAGGVNLRASSSRLASRQHRLTNQPESSCGHHSRRCPAEQQQ